MEVESWFSSDFHGGRHDYLAKAMNLRIAHDGEVEGRWIVVTICRRSMSRVLWTRILEWRIAGGDKVYMQLEFGRGMRRSMSCSLCTQILSLRIAGGDELQRQ